MNKGKKMRKRNILWFLSMILLMIGLGGCDSAKPVVDINPTLQESEVPSAEPSLLEQLEKKVAKHNGLVERTYHLEEEAAVFEEKLKVANHRIDDLEHGT